METINSSNGESGGLAEKSPRVTPHMVRSRTVELAIRAGRSPVEITQRDYEQAKRELTGETDLTRQQAVLYGQLPDGSVGVDRAEDRPVSSHSEDGMNNNG